MVSKIASIMTEVKYARADRKHGSKHHASAYHTINVKRYHRAVRRESRQFIAEEM